MLNLKIICTCLAISIGVCWAQDKNADSLRAVLRQTQVPLKRFSILNELILSQVQYAGHDVDSAYCTQLFQIAQQLKNDSLLAIGYNHLGTYFSFNKGDIATGLEFYFKGIPLAENAKDKRRISSLYFDIGVAYSILLNFEEALKNNRMGMKNLPDRSSPLYSFMLFQYQSNMLQYFMAKHQPDSALHFVQLLDVTMNKLSGNLYRYRSNYFNAAANAMAGDSVIADKYFNIALAMKDSIQGTDPKFDFYKYYIPFLLSSNRIDEAHTQAKQLIELGKRFKNDNLNVAGAQFLRQVFDKLHQMDSAYYYSRMEAKINDRIFSQNNRNKMQSAAFSEQIRLLEEKNKVAAYQSLLKQYALLSGLGIIIIIAFILYRNNQQKQKSNKILQTTLTNLKSTQSQLIQSEKMASLGELTAGIAHEIQNPLNFVNNFSEVSSELVAEMNVEIEKGNTDEVKQIAHDLKQNLEKINHHGKRAGDIVKSMLQHSRASSGQKEPTDINALADEYLRLAYHGLRAKDKSFNATMKTDFDDSVGSINIIPQDIGRVILNLITNAFYVVNERSKLQASGYEPQVVVSTKKDGNKILITVKDNGSGIPQKVLDKIFQPFFTTKPTGQGTGLGLSLSYDIVKAHGGELKVETQETQGTEFIICL